MLLKIKCPKCSGPMWEEELPDTQRIMDLVCIICGTRKFFNKAKYKAKRKEIEARAYGKTRPASR